MQLYEGEAGLVALKKFKLEQVARVTKLASFLIDYGFQSVRFYEAWSQVDGILGQVEDRGALERRLGRNVERLTGKIGDLEGEIRDLEKMTKDGQGAKAQKLYEFRAREYQEAHRMGEWFSNESGVRARGEPINPEKDP
jgi:hypothetical protein